MPGLDSLANAASSLQISHKVFLSDVKHHIIRTASIISHPNEVIGSLSSGVSYTSGLTERQLQTTQALLRQNHISQGGSTFPLPFFVILGALLVVAVILYFVRVSRKAAAVKKNEAQKMVSFPETRFSDLFGLDEVIEELQDLVYFLRNPDLALENNIEVPKGYLFVGPPGTGKTELAKAVAGEAQVPFFAHVGSEFNNKYVGEGAANLRKAFAAARAVNRPAVIFIDEIDAVGAKRASDPGGGRLEHNATLNQLLSLIDGFHDDLVVVIGATNFPDALDPALTRAGRLGVRVEIPVPDLVGRQKIFQHYTKKHHLAPEVDVARLARQTPAINGASVKNIVNTAAQLAWRRHRLHNSDRHEVIVEESDFNEAISREFLGLPRTKLHISDRAQRITAWHEAGHTLAALLLESAEDPSYITIVPRGPAGGLTFFPQKEELFMSKYEAMAQLVIAVSGRTAEEFLLGDDITQGASNDFQQATSLAKTMVAQYGMTPMGIVSLTPQEAKSSYVGEKLHLAADSLLRLAQEESRNLIGNNIEVLMAIVQALLVEKTLTTSRLWEIVHSIDPNLAPTTPGYQELVSVNSTLIPMNQGERSPDPQLEVRPLTPPISKKHASPKANLKEDLTTVAAIFKRRFRRGNSPEEIEA